jgi:hypothetical protein
MTEKGAKKGTITNKEIKRLTSKVLTRNGLYTYSKRDSYGHWKKEDNASKGDLTCAQEGCGKMTTKVVFLCENYGSRLALYNFSLPEMIVGEDPTLIARVQRRQLQWGEFLKATVCSTTVTFYTREKKFLFLHRNETEIFNPLTFVLARLFFRKLLYCIRLVLF